MHKTPQVFTDEYAAASLESRHCVGIFVPTTGYVYFISSLVTTDLVTLVDILYTHQQYLLDPFLSLEPLGWVHKI